MFAMSFGKCLDTCGINGHKIIPALNPELAKGFLFDQATHQLRLQLFRQLWWQITHDLINCVGMGQMKFKVPVIVFCKNNIATVTVICNLFSSFSQYKKHTNIHAIYLYIIYINCILVSIKMPQDHLTPCGKKKEKMREQYTIKQ